MRTKDSRWTAQKVADYFDSNLSVTMAELSDLSGWSVKALKRLLMGA